MARMETGWGLFGKERNEREEEELLHKMLRKWERLRKI
jgi:hypothetical protein